MLSKSSDTPVRATQTTPRRSQRLQSQKAVPSPLETVHLRTQATQTRPLRLTSVSTQTSCNGLHSQLRVTPCKRSALLATPRSEPRVYHPSRYRSPSSTPSKSVYESLLPRKDLQGAGRGSQQDSTALKSTLKFSKRRRTASWSSFTEPRRPSHECKPLDLSIRVREKGETAALGSEGSAPDVVPHMSFAQNSRSAQMLVAALKIPPTAGGATSGCASAHERKLPSGNMRRVTFK